MLLGWQNIALKAGLHCALILIQHLQNVTPPVHDISSDPVKGPLQTEQTCLEQALPYNYKT